MKKVLSSLVEPPSTGIRLNRPLGARRTDYDCSTYPILRFGDASLSVIVAVIDRPGMPFLGTGECVQGPTAAALANALAAATGRRTRSLPLARNGATTV